MEKLPTAEEWLKHFEENAYPGTPISECMIEFAKLHVEQALKEASEKFSHYSNKNVIINSYPLSNIK